MHYHPCGNVVERRRQCAITYVSTVTGRAVSCQLVVEFASLCGGAEKGSLQRHSDIISIWLVTPARGYMPKLGIRRNIHTRPALPALLALPAGNSDYATCSSTGPDDCTIQW